MNALQRILVLSIKIAVFGSIWSLFMFNVNTAIAGGSVLSSFDVPGSFPTGLAWDGNNLWIVDKEKNVFRVDSSGKVLKSFKIDFTAYGITWDGSHLWFVGDGKFVQFNTDGNKISSIQIDRYWSWGGLAWDGTHFWYTDYNSGFVYKYTRDGTRLTFFDSNLSGHPTGLAWDGKNLWVANVNNVDPNPVAFNLFYYNEEGIYYDEGKQGYVSAEQVNKEIAECNNNVEGDPLFKSMVDGDYHLRPGSPAIDAGDPSYDYSNEPKPNGSWINIGAYGNTKEAATSPPGNPSIRLSASSHDFGNIPVAGISPWTLTIHNQGTYKIWVRLSSGDPQFNSSHLFLVVMPSASKDVIIAFTPFSEGVRATSLECDNNLEGDPLFVDITKDDYSLRSPDSRAVDGGNPDSPFDPDGTRADIGAFFFDRKKIIPWDINKDGEINIFDIVIVARNIGQKDKEVKEGDVNVDGKVDIFDLVIVASHFGERSIAASPSLEVSQMDYSQYLSILEKAYQLLLVQASSNPSPEFEMARMLLERLISVAKPVVKETKLLPNYPNPFNPETWIPFQLAKGSEVVIRIYTVSGQLVRTLWLGFKDYGYYIQKERAASWDGRNLYGEQVASGIYLFTFQAGGYMATGKLLMIK